MSTDIKQWSWEQFVSQGLSIREKIEKNLWELAELCAAVETQYGEGSAKKFAGEIGMSERRVQELGYTWREWENRDRSRILSLKHHTIAARAEDSQTLIEKAEDSQWSVRELEKAIADEEVNRDLAALGLEEGDFEVVTETPGWRRRPCPNCDGEGEVWERAEEVGQEA